MSHPTRAVPSEQQRSFELALATYLKIDPTKWALTGWEVDAEQGRVEMVTVIPSEDFMYMFNTGTVPS